MRYFSQFSFFILLVMHLSGCALAPGMYFDDYSTEVETQAGYADITPTLRTITSQLIQYEKGLGASEEQVDISGFVALSQPYLIGSGDTLSIAVSDHPELGMHGNGNRGGAVLSPDYTVSTEGRIQFPYAGDLKVEGLSVLQARDLLVKRLAKYIKQPEVILKVLLYKSKRIFVDGEIKKPGIVAINDIPLSLPEALNRAGGTTPLGDLSRISVSRAGKVYWIDLPGLIKMGRDPNTIMLGNADIVRVSSRAEIKVFVMGDVGKPASLMMHNGYLSLYEALGEAAGIKSLTDSVNQIYVIRNAINEQPLIYHLDSRASGIFALAQNFDMRAKDVVYIDAAPKIRLDRIINLILPNAKAVTSVNSSFQ